MSGSSWLTAIFPMGKPHDGQNLCSSLTSLPHWGQDRIEPREATTPECPSKSATDSRTVSGNATGCAARISSESGQAPGALGEFDDISALRTRSRVPYLPWQDCELVSYSSRPRSSPLHSSTKR